MSKNTDEVLGHADESDGIEEYDNPLPDWWLGLFFVTIIWGVAYAADWHILNDRTQEGLYEAEVAAAKAQWPNLDKVASEADMSDANLALGAEVFETNCVSCHMADMTGGIGPNLIDTEWIHGGDFGSIVTTITEGVGAKGMPSWGPILGPEKVGAVASYVLSKNTGEAPAAAPEPAADATAAADGTAEAPEGEADGAVADVDPMVLGQQVFEKNCVACHMADMTGGVGPNLVDDEWIHGGSLDEIRTTIQNGVPAKGMITWKGVLPDAEIEAVAQYVHAKSHPE